MGAAWRAPKDRDIEKMAELVSTVKALGLETCATLGMLNDGHAETLRDAGLDYYNHNLDSAPDFYGDIITTRDYQDRLDTLERVRGAGVKVCCGGIVGMGETRLQRAGLIAQLANLDPYPESVPINNLVPVPGTPLADQPPLDLSSLCAPSLWRALPCPWRAYACRQVASRWATRCRPYAFWPVPIPFSTATSC